MEGQISIFDWMPEAVQNQPKCEYKLGEDIPANRIGRKLSFDEAYNYIGQVIGYVRHTQSNETCTAVKIRKIFTFDESDWGHRCGIRRAVADDSIRQTNPLLIDDCNYDQQYWWGPGDYFVEIKQ